MNVGAVLIDSTAQAASVLHDNEPTLSPSAGVDAKLWNRGAFSEDAHATGRGARMKSGITPRPETSLHTVQTDLNPDLARPVTTVLDARTQEVIREIPSKDIQRIAANLKDIMGLIFDHEG